MYFKVIESLEKPRQPLPDMDAIYLIEPEKSSINRIIADFEFEINKPVVYEVNLKKQCNFLNKISKCCNHLVHKPSENLNATGETKQKHEPSNRYKSASVYFVGLCKSYLIDQLKMSTAGKFIKLYKEISINYFPIERFVFSFKTSETLKHFYQKSPDEKRKAHLESIAEQLASVCASLNEYPIIRYRK